MELFSIRIQRTFQLVSTALQVKICNCIVDDTGLEPATLSLGS